MTYFREFSCHDMLKFNRINLDPLTETYAVSFYLKYLLNWPEYFTVAESPAGDMMGYIMGKCEGTGQNWHGHVSSLSVSNEFRRLQLANELMRQLEQVSDDKSNYFVDLFVRKSNEVGLKLYKKLGYTVFRTVTGYYLRTLPEEEDEDAYDMRKALSTDKFKNSIITDKKVVTPQELAYA